MLNRKARASGVLALLLLALTASGCLEQLSTTRIPEGAARNFFYFLVHNEQADATTYWAPNHTPPDAAAQVSLAISSLSDYQTDVTTSSAERQADGSMIVTLTGHTYRKGDSQTGPEHALIRVRLIEIGPGWRVSEFTLLCCTSP